VENLISDADSDDVVIM